MVLVGFLVAPIAAGVTYADATRLERPTRKRLAWALAVGTGSFSGFLVAHRYEEPLTRAYLHGVKPEPVLTSPSELLVVHLSVGAGVSVASLLAYAVAVRRGGSRSAVGAS